MLSVLRGARSLVCVLLVGAWFAFMSLPLRLVVLPGAFLVPSQRFRLVSLFMKAVVSGIWLLLRLGGARVRSLGRIPTREPVLLIGNHQSLTDILQVTQLVTPFVPAFVTRKRYQRFVPLVSASLRLLGAPIVDPKRDPEAALAAIRNGARELPHGIALFPEGHRSRDGRVLPFRLAGADAILAERTMPVYLVVNDGAWRVGRLSDLLFRVHWIDAYSEVLGPFAPPAEAAERAAFLRGLRQRIVEALERHRAGSAAA